MKQFQAICLTAVVLTTIAGAQTPALQKGISVQLPNTSTAAVVPAADNQDALILSVTHEGRVFLRNDEISPVDVQQKIQAELASGAKKTLYIKADARAPYASVVQILDEAHAAGVQGIALLTSQSDGPTPGKLAPPKGLEMLIVPAHGPR
ncbi:MAG TPA: biopolymer transporter ExbD [Terriglobales bacterium]|jgi:biopolymer transport protein ExbD|nr:biopolymer transporter ExbD [Terriglobales bacterium]